MILGILFSLCVWLVFIAGQQLFTNGALLINNPTPVPTEAEATPTALPTNTAMPTPTATVTPMPTTPAEAAAPPTTPCQNTDWFDASVNPPGGLIDIVLVGGEPCAAYWRSAGTSFTSAVCPQGWVCTFSTQAGTQVFLGTGQVVGVNGATWRPLAEFCTVLAGERRFAASQTPTFEVSPAPGSPSCDPASG